MLKLVLMKQVFVGVMTSYKSIDRVECYKVHLVYSVKPHGRQWPTSNEK